MPGREKLRCRCTILTPGLPLNQIVGTHWLSSEMPYTGKPPGRGKTPMLTTLCRTSATCKCPRVGSMRPSGGQLTCRVGLSMPPLGTLSHP